MLIPDVRFGSFADMAAHELNVRFYSESGRSTVVAARPLCQFGARERCMEDSNNFLRCSIIYRNKILVPRGGIEPPTP